MMSFDQTNLCASEGLGCDQEDGIYRQTKYYGDFEMASKARQPLGLQVIPT